jgi:hypothetical protein
MADMDQLAKALNGAGLKADKTLRERLDREAGEQPEYAEPAADARAAGGEPQITRGGTGLRATGPYEVLGAWRKGEVSVVVEQNTDQAGTHEPVAVVDGPNGFRVACSPDDHDLLLAETAAAAGDFSHHERRNTEAALRRAGFEPDQAKPSQWVRNGFRITLGLLLLFPSLLIGRLLGLVWLVSPNIVSNATKKALLDAWYSAAALGAPATHYFGLSTTTPNEDGTGVTEPVANGYARVAVTANTTNFALSTAADLTLKRNATVVTFPAATGSWGTVTYSVVLNHVSNAASATTVTDWQALSASQAIGNGTTASYAANAWESNLT